MTTTIEQLDAGGATVATVTLDFDMIWTDQKSWNPIISEIEDTIQGGRTSPLEISRTNNIGRPITLESRDGYGRQQGSTVDALRAILLPETKYQLTILFDALSFQDYVIFRNWESGGAMSFEKYKPRDGLMPDSFWYEGVLSMEICAAP